MSTLCTDIQQVLSASYDGDALDPDAMKAARTHCASCPECAAFVQFLAGVRALPSPVAPERAIVRALDEVRAAQEASRAAEEPAPAAQAELLPPATAPAEVTEGHTTRRRGFEIGGWRPTAPWYAAAATLLVGALLVTAQGIGYIMDGAGQTSATLDTSAPEVMVFEDSALQERASGEFRDDSDKDTGTGLGIEPGAANALAGALIAYGGYAYEARGDAEPPIGPATGTVTSALDASTAPVAQWSAWADPSGRTVIIDAGERGFLRFERVDRMLDGLMFARAADRIDYFGAPLRLPASITLPTTTDGSPTFVPAGLDDLGAEVYVRAGTVPSSGFALAPGAVGPEWTWWIPVR